MAGKVTVVLDPHVGRVEYHYRLGQRNMRISLRPNHVRVSLPAAVSQRQAQRFLNNKRDWILKHRYGDDEFVTGMGIGRWHRLVIRPGVGGSFVKGDKLYVSDHPPSARRAIIGVLRSEAESLLLPRLEELVAELGVKQSVRGRLRHMQTRWGSCLQHKSTICLNTLLVQLPAEVIDYVIIHELCHLQEANHSPAFWQLVAGSCPDYKARKKKLDSYRPVIIDRLSQATGRPV